MAAVLLAGAGEGDFSGELLQRRRGREKGRREFAISRWTCSYNLTAIGGGIRPDGDFPASSAGVGGGAPPRPTEPLQGATRHPVI